MEIPRKALAAKFYDFASSNSGVVIGHPGAGKTYTVSAFCREVLKQDGVCLYLPIDKLGIETIGDLKESLGITGDFVSFLRNERKASEKLPGFLVIDGFDAARSEITQRQLMSLIQRIFTELPSTWRVIVSVRTYDAMKSPDLLAIFPKASNGDMPAKYRAEGVNCRHFFIPLLENEEVRCAVETIPGLAALYPATSEDFKELLRTPFNLWLLEQLLSDPSLLPQLTTVNSEIELLAMFWRERVEKTPRSEALTAVASRVAQALIVEHALSVRKDKVYTFEQDMAWHDLLSSGVLAEVGRQRQRIGFGHNILFDYAVSVLLIEDTPEEFEKFVNAEPSRPLFLRPSLNYYFTRLWHIETATFWKIFWHILRSRDIHLRLFARLLPTAVIVTELRKREEITPLLNYRFNNPELADEGILRLLQALKAIDVRRDALWIDILEEISNDCSPRFVSEMATYIHAIYGRAREGNCKELQSLCGTIARNLLHWLWKQRRTEIGKHFDRLGSGWLVPIVAKTFAWAPRDSRQVLEPIFELVREKGFPIDYLFRLTSELNYIVEIDSDFVSRVYKVVFENPETSEEKTEMGSPIMPMSSTRMQDYRMCHYNLKRQFPRFIRTAPEVATATAIQCLNPYILGLHVMPYLKEGVRLEETIERFAFRGKQAYYLPDTSYIWHQTTHREEPIEIAAALFEFIREIAKQPQKEDTLEALLDVFRDNVAAAFFWAELLRVAAEDPLPFVDRLFELCLAKPIQLGNETVHQLGTFVEVAAKYFSQDQIKALELSFLAIAAGQDAQKNSEFYENRRNRLLTRIPETMLTTENARMIVTELQRKKAVPINAPLVKFESWSEPFDEKEWLKEQGANWRNRANVNMHGYFERLGQFSSKWQNKNPSQDDVTAILPVLREAYELLHQNHGADKPVENTLWTKVGECAETMARAEMNPIGQAFQFCRQTLLECAKHPEPEPDPEYDNKYEFPSWSPAPRNEAAQGLPWLAVWAAGDMEIIQAIGSLLRDPKPSVRFLVTSELWRLRRHYTDQFWLLAEQIAENETNKVVQQALCQTLSHFVAIEEEKTCRLLAKISLIPIEGEDKSNLLDSFVQLVMWLVFVRENGWAQSKAEEFLQNPRKFRKVLSRATLDALSLITPQNIQSNERKKHAERAREWILRAICVAAKELGRFRNLPEGSISEEIRTEVRDIYGVIDEVVMRFYFASGLFEHSKDGPFISADQQREFYFFIKPVLDKVVEVSDYEKGGIFFAPTAHYFMQLLIGVLPHDPKGVLHLANRVASIARGGGYNFDSMAVGEVVKLVEYILANHRIDIRDRESLDDLLGLLDIFADVGWPEALHLVWRLDEVFR